MSWLFSIHNTSTHNTSTHNTPWHHSNTPTIQHTKEHTPHYNIPACIPPFPHPHQHIPLQQHATTYQHALPPCCRYNQGHPCVHLTQNITMPLHNHAPPLDFPGPLDLQAPPAFLVVPNDCRIQRPLQVLLTENIHRPCVCIGVGV